MKQRLDKVERLAQQADARTLERRSFLQRAAGLAVVTTMAPAAFARNFGPSTEPQRYPDPDIIALDKRVWRNESVRIRDCCGRGNQKVDELGSRLPSEGFIRDRRC